MNRNHLALFYAVAEHGGFSRAAEKLLISQPAVSLQVADLESALGVKLFDRLPRGVRLTEAGQLLFSFARRIANLEEEAERAIRELRGLERGRLLIGASLTVGSYVLPPVMGQFRKRHPGIELVLEIANTHEVQRRLSEGLLDVALTEGFVDAEELESEAFAEDELVAIAPPDHPLLAAKKRVTAAELCQQPLIFRERGSGTREVIEHALSTKKLNPTPVMSLGSTEAIKAAVACGMGLAIVSALAIPTELKAGTLAVLPLADLTIRRELHRLTLKGKAPSAATRAFLELLHSGKGKKK